MRIRNDQRGEGRLGCIFWVLFLGIGIMIAVKMIPVKIAIAELEDHMEELAERHPRGNSQQFRTSIYKKAQELDLPVQQKEIEVQKSKQRAVMTVEFVKPIDFVVYTYQWKIRVHVDRDVYLI